MCRARLGMGGGERKGCQVCEPNGFAPFDFAQGFFVNPQFLFVNLPYHTILCVPAHE